MARIFVINDEADLIEACSMALEEAGHDAVPVSSTEHVVELSETLRPDLVLIDLVMPGDGETVIQALRSSRTAEVPIVAMSALVDGRSRAMRAGADAFLPKPFGVSDLYRAVDDTLRRRRAPSVQA